MANRRSVRVDLGQPSSRRGAAFGLVGGIISGIGFAGVILWFPMLFGMPTGTFMQTLGMMAAGQRSDFISMGFAGFGIILAQCIIVGIIYGVVVSRVRSFWRIDMRRGAGLGVITGAVAFAAIYMPIVLTVFPNALQQSLQNFSQVDASMIGMKNYTLMFPSFSDYLVRMTTFGIVAYLFYGFMMGGIVGQANFVLRYNLEKEKLEQLK